MGKIHEFHQSQQCERFVVLLGYPDEAICYGYCICFYLSLGRKLQLSACDEGKYFLRERSIGRENRIIKLRDIIEPED